MAIRRVHRKVERTSEEMASLRAIRENFQSARPGLDDLAASDDYDVPQKHGDVMALLSALASLKRERERRGFSLAEVSERSGIDKGMLSRLETGKILNPTVTTLSRYAEAVGARLEIGVRPERAGIDPEAPFELSLDEKARIVTPLLAKRLGIADDLIRSAVEEALEYLGGYR
jgi:transcriptional regulator with XRE-family HTH domain